jgi:hypothetical protein
MISKEKNSVQLVRLHMAAASSRGLHTASENDGKEGHKNKKAASLCSNLPSWYLIQTHKKKNLDALED